MMLLLAFVAEQKKKRRSLSSGEYSRYSRGTSPDGADVESFGESSDDLLLSSVSAESPTGDFHSFAGSSTISPHTSPDASPHQRRHGSSGPMLRVQEVRTPLKQRQQRGGEPSAEEALEVSAAGVVEEEGKNSTADEPSDSEPQMAHSAAQRRLQGIEERKGERETQSMGPGNSGSAWAFLTGVEEGSDAESFQRSTADTADTSGSRQAGHSVYTPGHSSQQGTLGAALRLFPPASSLDNSATARLISKYQRPPHDRAPDSRAGGTAVPPPFISIRNAEVHRRSAEDTEEARMPSRYRKAPSSASSSSSSRGVSPPPFPSSLRSRASSPDSLVKHAWDARGGGMDTAAQARSRTASHHGPEGGLVSAGAKAQRHSTALVSTGRGGPETAALLAELQRLKAKLRSVVQRYERAASIGRQERDARKRAQAQVREYEKDLKVWQGRASVAETEVREVRRQAGYSEDALARETERLKSLERRYQEAEWSNKEYARQLEGLKRRAQDLEPALLHAKTEAARNEEKMNHWVRAAMPSVVASCFVGVNALHSGFVPPTLLLFPSTCAFGCCISLLVPLPLTLAAVAC